MIRFDAWSKERETAEVLSNGLKLYCYRTATGKPAAMLFYPKATKPAWSYTFRNDEQRAEYIRRSVEGFAAHQAAKKARRVAEKQGDLSLADPGAIFEYSWGYDQTNVDYFQVVSRSGYMVELRPIACESVPGSGYSHGMADQVRPKPDAFCDPCAECGCYKSAAMHHGIKTREGNEPHDYRPAPPTRKKVYFYKGEPSLSFDHGCGSLVKVLRFGNMPALATSSHYRSWYA